MTTMALATIATIPTHRIETLREVVRRSQLEPQTDLDPYDLEWIEPILAEGQLNDLLDILDAIIEERRA